MFTTSALSAGDLGFTPHLSHTGNLTIGVLEAVLPEASVKGSVLGLVGPLIILIIAFKGAIQNILQSPHCTTKCFQHVSSSGWAQSCANHVQHIECLSRLTCHDTCHVVRKDGSAIKFDRA